MRLAVNLGGIPYLAKNERDMGHPSLSARLNFCLCRGEVLADVSFHRDLIYLV
jgi:hypothetical protein